MKVLILWLSLTTAAWGVTASPSSITVYMRGGQGLGFGWASTRSPQTTAITISGSGSWNLARGGDLSTACGASNGYCFNASTSATAAGAGALPSGSGPGTIYLYWTGLGVDFILSNGTHTGTLTVGDTVISITVVVQPRQAFDPFVYRPGNPTGCTNTNAGYSFADTCTITSERPTSTALSIPAPGGSLTDPQFGHTLTRITPAKNNIQYAALTAFSASAQYIMTDDMAGTVSMYTKTGSVAYNGVPGVNINFAAWDPADDERVWYMDGATIKRRQLNTGVVTTAADYSATYSGITMGGTLDITDDGWWAFLAGDDVCAVNLNGLTTGTQASKTFCANLTPYSLSFIDFPQITQVDSETGKRYLVLLSQPTGLVFSVGAAALTYEHVLPTGTSDIAAVPHSDVGQDSQGRQIFFWQWYTPYDNKYYLASVQLNKGLDMTWPVETGGGLRLLYSSDAENFSTDNHFGCTWKGVCVFSPYGNSGGISASRVASVTAATPCQITTSSSHGFTTGNSVLIGGAAGITSINGVFTATVTGATTFTLDGHACAGTYTANSAHVVLNTASATTQPNRQEIVVSRPGQEVRRVAIHRSKIYSGGDLVGYFATPRASISRDGRYVAFASNFGIPEQPSVWIADTGVSQPTGRIVATFSPADTAAIVNYSVPASQGAATILISASPTLTSPVVNTSDGLGGQARQYVATGLTAGTQYWYRITTGLYATRGTFTTTPTLSGTALLRITKGGGGTIQYGTTPSLGSSGASPLAVSIAKGVVYYNSGGGVQAVVNR